MVHSFQKTRPMRNPYTRKSDARPPNAAVLMRLSLQNLLPPLSQISLIKSTMTAMFVER